MSLLYSDDRVRSATEISEKEKKVKIQEQNLRIYPYLNKCKEGKHKIAKGVIKIFQIHSDFIQHIVYNGTNPFILLLVSLPQHLFENYTFPAIIPFAMGSKNYRMPSWLRITYPWTLIC